MLEVIVEFTFEVVLWVLKCNSTFAVLQTFAIASLIA
jgi:hypothetical protein